MAADVAWAGTSADEWIFAPVELRYKNYRGLRTVWMYLVDWGASNGYYVPYNIVGQFKEFSEGGAA